MPAVHIGCSADEKYAPGLAVTLRSLSDTCSLPVEAWVIDGGLSAETRAKLESSWPKIHVHWLEPDFSDIKMLKEDKWFNYLVYARLLFPQLVTGTKRLLYLDSDMLVRADVARLYDEDLHGQAFGAVQDLGCLTVSEPKYGLMNYRELGISANHPYCNCGLLLLDVARWESLEISQRALHYVAQHPTLLRWLDQDAINVVAGECWLPLDPAWNSLYEALQTMDWSDDRTDAETLSRFSKEPNIVHFIGPVKPWQPGCTHARTAEFAAVLARTAFADALAH